MSKISILQKMFDSQHLSFWVSLNGPERVQKRSFLCGSVTKEKKSSVKIHKTLVLDQIWKTQLAEDAESSYWLLENVNLCLSDC